jgi:ribosome-binding ATPase YchF (GTP1/OBG family)
LHLITYFTVGPKETRAWTMHARHQGAAGRGVIHTDFERGFIRAQTIALTTTSAFGRQGKSSRTDAKEAGKARDEGKEYVVQDGDVGAMHVRAATSCGQIQHLDQLDTRSTLGTS